VRNSWAIRIHEILEDLSLRIAAVSVTSMAKTDKRMKLIWYDPVLSLTRPAKEGPKDTPMPIHVEMMPKPRPRLVGLKIFDGKEKIGAGTSATAIAIIIIGKMKFVELGII